MPRSKTRRVEFTTEHDVYLAKYLATYAPSKQGRSGNQVFQRLVENGEGRWPWSVHHPWQSWRERYVRNASHFDARIAKYQAKRGNPDMRKTPAGTASVDKSRQSAKRIKLEATKGAEQEDKGEGSSGERHAGASTSTAPTRGVEPSTPQRLSTNKNAPEQLPSNQQPLAPMGDKPPPAKQLKKRARASSEVFASEPPSPRQDSGSSHTRPASNAVSPNIRAPPRFVNSFDGQVLVDHKGRVPRAYPTEKEEEEGEEEKEEEEKEEEADKVQWPPIRSHPKKKKAGEPDVVDVHHPFSQPEPLPQPREEGNRERIHPFETDKHTAAALFLGRSGVPVESDGASPVKRVALTPDPFVSLAPKPSKVPHFPPPRASTSSPFRPASPTVPKPRVRRTRVARHPALARVQRQSDNGTSNKGKEVPSIDLVALSQSSASAHLHSSELSVRPARWSLPALPSVPWVNDHGASSSAMGSRSRSGSGTGSGSPYRWDRPLVPFTPSPARSLTDGGTASVALVDQRPRRMPHGPDLALVLSHGLDSILAHMAANHELGLNVVTEVYDQVGSLAEADEVLRGMREAAEGFGDREIERRSRASAVVGYAEDEEEYSPPETSRAAMWKRAQEEEERRAVEAQLVVEEDPWVPHGLDKAIVEPLLAQALVRQMGRAWFRREIARRFV